MQVYSIHDIKPKKTRLVGKREFLEFLFEHGSEFASAHELGFAIENYGPRIIKGQYVVTMHDTDKLG